MKMKSIFAAAVLALSGVSSFASSPSFSFTGTYAASYLLDVDPGTGIKASVSSTLVDGLGFDITSVTLNGTPFDLNTTTFQGITFENYSFISPALAGGMYTLSVFGTGTNGAGYTGNVVLTSPVPEPETYALMLAGLGVGGFLLKRRKSD